MPSTVGTTRTSGGTPSPANSVPSGNVWRVTQNCTPQPLGRANVATSPALPAEGSPMITPRRAAGNAARKSSAALPEALDASTAIGPPSAGWSVRGATLPAAGAFQLTSASPRLPPHNAPASPGAVETP